MLNYKRLAAIDIGTNAIRLLIMNAIETEEDPLFKKASLIRVPVRLGLDVFGDRREISAKNIDKMMHTMSAFRHLMLVNDVYDYRACATSAMREAENGDEVAQQVLKETGIQIDIIEGGEEADIIYSTHIAELLDSEKNYLYVDVGGGSTEITMFSRNNRVASRSFNIGTIRILSEKVDEQAWGEMEKWVAEISQNFDQINLIGSGGNINKIFKMSGKKLGKPMTYEYLKNTVKYLQLYTVDERVKVLDLNIDRADVIVPAANIFLSVMRKSHAKKIYVPKIGLSDGIIRTIYGREERNVIEAV